MEENRRQTADRRKPSQAETRSLWTIRSRAILLLGFALVLAFLAFRALA